ncbi:hypothetical protein C8F01DRAFT_1241970 [Mycena amicta]|nr:hypothetical protein C8F01DRAFT_1241970 [Mycena amicta]
MSAFDLSPLSIALPASRTAAEQREYDRLRQRVQSLAYGYRGDPSLQTAAKFYAVWEGRDVGIFADWDLCSASVIGYPGNGYKRMRSWDQAVDAVTGYLWVKRHEHSNTTSTGPLPTVPQPRGVSPTPRPTSSLPSPSTPSSLSASTRRSHRTPSRPPSTPTRAPAQANAPRATPNARPLQPSDTQTFYIITGRCSALFFVDSAEAKEAAFQLEELGELEDFCCTQKLSDALERLNLAANLAVGRDVGL